jgi:uncharacterized OB-fold protein
MAPKQIPIVDYLVLGDQPHLVANECTNCGAIYFDRRNACANCGQTSFGTRELGTTGVVRSFAIVHQAAPGVPVPYVSTVVDLDGGGQVKANVVNVEPEPDKLSLGMKVRLTTFVAGTDDDGTQAVAFGFEPV